jgi:hypothetical protein
MARFIRKALLPSIDYLEKKGSSAIKTATPNARLVFRGVQEKGIPYKRLLLLILKNIPD